MQTRTIQIPAQEIRVIENWLTSDHALPQAGECETISTYTVKFAEQVEADIKVVNSDSGPYVDAVWFDDGCEIGFLEVRDTLLGEYVFIDKYDNAEYKVIVEQIA